MALNSDLAVRRATEKLLDIVAREQAAQFSYIEQLIRERDAALEEAKKAKEQLEAYKIQVQQYKSEAHSAKQQLAKPHAPVSLTVGPVHDLPGTAESRPRLQWQPSTDKTVRKKRRWFPTAVAHPTSTATTSRVTEDANLSLNTVSMSSNHNGTDKFVHYYPNGEAPTWCYCGKREYGTMVRCSSSSCPKQWFHVHCTGLEQVPEVGWKCRVCHTNQAP